MVQHAGSPTGIVHAYVTLNRVKGTGLLNFRQLAKPCMLAAMTLRGFLVLVIMVALCNRADHYIFALWFISIFFFFFLFFLA